MRLAGHVALINETRNENREIIKDISVHGEGNTKIVIYGIKWESVGRFLWPKIGSGDKLM